MEWEVNEITIEDKYEILLSATFETNVPAAVVVTEPMSVTLPDMEKGDVYLGEFTLTNHGLVRADNLTVPVPASDDNFQYELLTGIPDSLDAKQRITIPYRITCLKSLDADDGEDQTGGGCYSYSKCIPIAYGYKCANGQITNGTTRHCFYKTGGTCGSDGSGGSGGSGGGGSAIYSGGSGGGSSSSPAPAYTPMETSEQKCLPILSTTEMFLNFVKGAAKEVWARGTQLAKDSITFVGCSVNTALREYNDQATDLWVKVPNGRIALSRIYSGGTWQWDHESLVYDGTPDDKFPESVTTAPDNVTKDGAVYEKSA